MEFREGSRLEKIGAYCFAGCDLKEVAIPRSVVEIGEYAFVACKSLRRVTFQEGSKLQKIGGHCFSSGGLEEFVAPPGLKVIENGAFYMCDSLKRAVLNEGLEKLPSHQKGFCYYGVFDCSGIEEITLPSTLGLIGGITFDYCRRLQAIYVASGCQADLSELRIPK